MRTLAPAFAAHIASGATTLATCWRMERTDGLVLGFTDHDLALTVDDTLFEPASGAEGGQTATKLGAATDATEIIGLISSDAITDSDILLGRYDGASVETWRVNWRDTSQRHLMRRDTVGEIVREDSRFRVELRSAQQALNVRRGRLYQALCGTNLGDSPCGIDLDTPVYKTTGLVEAVPGTNAVRVSGLSGFAAGWFDFGRLQWTSGDRTGRADRILSHARRPDGDTLYLDAEVADWVAIGDGFVAVAGCDRSFSTCRSKFGNQLNFRGFPHIPGSDFVLTYPRPGDALAGSALVK